VIPAVLDLSAFETVDRSGFESDGDASHALSLFSVGGQIAVGCEKYTIVIDLVTEFGQPGRALSLSIKLAFPANSLPSIFPSFIIPPFGPDGGVRRRNERAFEPAKSPRQKGSVDVQHDDGSGRDGNAGHGCSRHGNSDDGIDNGDARPFQLDDGAAVHLQDGTLQRRHEDHLLLRRQDGPKHGAKPLHDVGGRHVHLLHDDERHDGLLLQFHDGNVQVRDDEGRRLLDVHEWRSEVLRDDPGLLRLPGLHAQGRLHLLHALQQHAGLLRLLLVKEKKRVE